MYSREEYQQVREEVAKEYKTYDENSVDKSREKWLDARERRQDLEASRANMDAIYEARQVESDAEKELEDATHHASHLAAAKQHREHMEQAEQAARTQQEEAQKQYAAQEKATFRVEAKVRYLAAGGTEEQFNHAFPDLWAKELERRTLTGHDEKLDRMRARYSSAHI